MLDDFLTFINAHKIPLSSKRTLLTVSGGIDSVVMADLFYKAGFGAGVAHCNFGLRGEESEGDAVFVKRLAASYGFSFYTQRFDTNTLVQQKGISTQMAARELRYRWFEEIRRAEGYDYIATAHHGNDALETVLLNLVRGTGLAGLKGIAFQTGFLIRPFLFATRETIDHYARENNLIWREDSSNQSTYYRRNLIRHRVVPILKEINPSLETTFQLTAERLRAAEVLLTAHLNEWQTTAVRTEGTTLRVSIAALRQTNEPVFRLAEVLQPYGFSYPQVRQIFDSLGGQVGKLFHSATHTLVKDRTELLLTPTALPPSEVSIAETESEVPFREGTLRIHRQVRSPDYQHPASPQTASFDSSLLQYPLCLRQWRQGDWFCPLGMGGKKKKISDLLIDLKIPRSLKETVSVLTDNQGRILWVVGLRTDHRFQITGHTTKITQISIVPTS
ncbi:tRNA lysidine(34) synthetase TilS [Telluribacter sp.]|jgi:tRNA(Ile)-lysidine synthase|uniref:tRNA lysidine(34) synthetase TilS n=1 Tax=Telluribacter sp. TaxID=1978767 RepID=UPI002E0D2A94|nr:tRNA lysidine(34) synthetase TilS [Telluribacter sp.]